MRVPPGHKMSFKDALHYTSTNMIVPVVFPGWALNLTAKLRTIRDAVKELRVCTPSLSSLVIVKLTLVPLDVYTGFD